ncbi:Putative pterin-4-alpha-carbinolamine dehydratase [Maioricimonas rarisocia]|uniref:Putative pterin-4-alpha-carbinolamine dehydratase n=1 Tax=Maioricimonas rarisocia TaxID=2528026 RepID=A0A517ZEE8_9PLAN|nr:4a-hydroxytetrahydrobiopterin dehydratase [Maioricimonas rarisocia]QDU40873.1 Putative pterin-4-alpha-carbinolamine dehydratase [Maioricimonas rarisocia]
MNGTSANALREKSCKPCEGGTEPLERDKVEQTLAELNGWDLDEGGKMIRRKWATRDFKTAVEFVNRVADVAEQEQHHPDLHLTGYRNVTIELTTHAIDGLSENDFIVAAKIDDLPVTLKKEQG